MPDIVYNITSCEEATISTPTVDREFISYFTNTFIGVKDYTDIEYYSVVTSKSCCEETTVNIAPPYVFVPSIINCNDTTIGNPAVNVTIYTLEINGINADYVSTMMYELTGNPLTTLSFTNNNGVLTVDILATQAPTTLDYTMEITTNQGFVYTIEFTITQVSNDPCNTHSIALTSTDYPDLPESISLVNTDQLDLTVLFTDPLVTGVYNITMYEIGLNTYSIQNHYFIECDELKCMLVNELALCVETNVYNLYNALVYSNECTEAVTYQELCSIWELMMIKLLSDSCYDIEDECNCTGIKFKSNTTYSSAKDYNTSNNDCGCG